MRPLAWNPFVPELSSSIPIPPSARSSWPWRAPRLRRHNTAADREEALEHARSREYIAVILEPRMREGDLLLRELSSRNLIVAGTVADAAIDVCCEPRA